METFTSSSEWWKTREPKGLVTWIDGYKDTVNHPHRQVILDSLGTFKSLLEVGCACGPNLLRIKEKHPDALLSGEDINAYAIEEARKLLPTVDFKVSSITQLDYPDKSFDIVLADSVLMYVDPQDIKKVLSNLVRIARKEIIIVDQFNKWDIKLGYSWARNYIELMLVRDCKVEARKLTEKEWNSPNWIKHGYLFVCRPR